MRKVGMLLAMIMAVAVVPMLAQDGSAPSNQTASVMGTVTDANDAVVPGANVVVQGPAAADRHAVTSNNTGFFEIRGLQSGVAYNVTVSEKGFADWTTQFNLEPGQSLILSAVQLSVARAQTSVDVSYTAEEIATQQVKLEEQQRVFGIIPNFYVVYDQDNALPLTPKLKFRLAMKVATDPVTVAGVGFLAGIYQAGDIPDYQQGAKGYGQRFGAIAADGFSDIMIGGAILPSLLHQDPRYFYQGTGTTKSRMLHAMSNPFVCRGDNGHRQPNYSSIGGDLFSAALSNAYYPSSNRSAGMFIGNFAITTGQRVISSLVQEFILGRFTKRGEAR